MSVEEFVGLELARVPGVEQVLTSPGEDMLVWTVVNHASEEVHYRIYDREGALLDMFPDQGFDFYVLDRRGRQVEELVTGMKPIFQRH